VVSILSSEQLNLCTLCANSGMTNYLKSSVIMVMWPIFTAQCYAGALYAVILCSSLCLSVTRQLNVELCK